MESIPLLKDLVVLMATAVPISILLTRIGLPIIIGFLITGVIIGPYGFALITEIKTVETLAQIGTVLLLFTIGLEFSLTRMLDIRREGILGGGLQVVVTSIAVVLIGMAFKFPLGVCVLLGFIISLSSTAIVLKLLADKGEINSAHGNLSVGVLLFQDICVVPMVIVLQGIGKESADTLGIAKDVGASIAAILVIIAAVLLIIPRLFNQVVRLKSREVFILTTVLVCMGTAWVSSIFGLSLALGAFIAGIAISESEYSNQIVAEVIPFRDVFSSLFFVSIGMLLDVRFFAANAPLLLLLVAGIIFIKAASLALVAQVLSYPLRLSIIVGLNLAQIGEFSFILINMGKGLTLLSPSLYQSMLALAVVSMAAAPFLNRWSHHMAFFAAERLGRGGRGGLPLAEAHKRTRLTNHVIIVGYGLNGENLVKVLKETGIPHLVVDTNMQRIRTAKAHGCKAYFGDASHPEILKGMGLNSAKMLVVAISDPVATRGIVKEAKKANPSISVLVRTRYTREVEELYRLGADQVIPEEFETSVEIFARVLKDYRIPGNIIQNQIKIIRDEGYAMLRTPSVAGERLGSLTAILEKGLMDTYYIEKGCAIAGRALKELELRRKTGSTVIAVLRHGEAKTNPGAEFTILEHDTLILIGNHAELNSAFELLKQGCPIDNG